MLRRWLIIFVELITGCRVVRITYDDYGDVKTRHVLSTFKRKSSTHSTTKVPYAFVDWIGADRVAILLSDGTITGDVRGHWHFPKR